MNNKKYKKRSGTAGVHGQFFESKMLTLLNFRAQHDDDIEEFYLATNVDFIGEFDDICIRAKVKSFAKQMAVFLQTKHRETDRVLSLSIKHDLTRCFKSYLKIRRAFGTKHKDLQTALFGGTFSETECLFVMYTNAKYDFNNDLVETEYTTKLKELIGTEKEGSYLQPTYKPEDMEFLSKVILEEEIVTLAEHFAKLVNKEVIMDELVSCYHYILAQKVFEISDIVNDEGLRTASFRNDFFDTNEHFVLIFKNTLYEQVLMGRNIDKRTILTRLDTFFSRTSEVNRLKALRDLIVTVIVYKNGKFEFVNKSLDLSEDLKRKLNEVRVSQVTVDKAIDQAAKEELEKWKFFLPVPFGNKDLTLWEHKKEKILNKLSSTIVDLINKAKPNTNIITIDESLKPGLLKVNGGLAGLVGNVFVPDENSKLMKFADNIESIKGDLAKKLYLELEKEINNLQEYRIDVKVKKFPKLSFHSREYDENLVKDFLRRLIFFTNQSKQNEIDIILKQEIGFNLYDGKRLNQAQVDAVFLKYHKAMQDWWIDPNNVEYLTKHSKHFENATKDIIKQSLIYTFNMIHTFNMQNIKYTFNAAAVSAFKILLDQQCNQTNANVNINIVTDNCKFTVAKLTHYLNDKKHVVLDIESISNLLPIDYKTLRTELAENKETVIFVNYGNWCGRFNDIVKAVKAQLFIVTKAKPNNIDSYAHDFANNLVDLSEESQQTFLKNTNVIFQGEKVSLGLFVKDEKAREVIKGDIFHKMLDNTIFKIGMPIGNQNYDDFKHLYTDRRVSRTRKTEEDAFHEVKDKLIQTLSGLQDHVILVTAMPGMGKSTLLTHLSIKTKELYPNTWIVRINLLEYSRIFSKLQTDKTVIDPKLSLYFMCLVALGVAEKNITAKLQTVNNVVSLIECSGDASITFGFEMFLHFYNSGTLIFLFDGFDEIFPQYAKEALSLVKTVRSYPRQHKIWITSRSYNDIKDILEPEFGRSYELEGFSDVEQARYLKKYWIKRELKKFGKLERTTNSKILVPCYHPLYLTRYYPDEQTTVPCFKVYFTEEDVVKLELDGYIDEFNPSTSSSNTVWRNDSNTAYYKKKKKTTAAYYTSDKNTAYYSNDFFATPLHLYFLAACLIPGRCIRVSQNIQPSVNLPGLYDKNGFLSMEMSVFELYLHFVENKLQNIRFKEKNKVDISIPDNISINERERAYVLAKHKKLGAYAIFYSDKDLIFNDIELKEVMENIDMLKLGNEKSGFIHSVAGDIPLFIHRLIAEYFAAEYIDDLLKSEITDETRESILGLSKVGQVYEILTSKWLKEKNNKERILEKQNNGGFNFDDWLPHLHDWGISRATFISF